MYPWTVKAIAFRLFGDFLFYRGNVRMMRFREKEKNMKITLRDNVREYDRPVSILEIAQDISEGLARVACVGKVNGEVADLRTIVSDDAEVEILTFDAQEGKDARSVPRSKKVSITISTGSIPLRRMNLKRSKPR